MRSIIGLLFFSIIFLVTGKAMGIPTISSHPYFVSTTEVHINTKDSSVGVICKMFSDDLEVALKNTYSVSADVRNTVVDSLVAVYLEKYIRNKLAVSINGKDLTLNWLGFENVEEKTYCYFESRWLSSVKTVAVTCKLLYESFTEQVGFIHVYVDESRQSYKLANPNSLASFLF